MLAEFLSFKHIERKHAEHQGSCQQRAEACAVQPQFGETEFAVNQHPVAEYVDHIADNQKHHRHHWLAHTVGKLLEHVETQLKKRRNADDDKIRAYKRQKFRCLTETVEKAIDDRQYHKAHKPDGTVHQNAVLHGGANAFHIVHTIKSTNHRSQTSGES